jgi:hypothetical protein
MSFRNDHLVYFVAICFVLCQFGIFRVHLYYPHFGILYQEKSGNPVCSSNGPCAAKLVIPKLRRCLRK